MILAAGLAQLPEKLGRSGVAASRAWQGLDHYAPNRHDIGSTTARSVDEVALIRDTVSHYAPVLIAQNSSRPASVAGHLKEPTLNAALTSHLAPQHGQLAAAVPPIKLDPFFEVRTPEPFGSRLVAWPSVGCRYQPRPADASASSAAIGTWAASTGHVTPPPGGSSPTCSRGYPEVRTTQRRGQRIFTSHARSTPSITPGSRTSAKIMPTSRPPISMIASAASALSHSIMSRCSSSNSVAPRLRTSASSSTINTAGLF